MSTGPACLLVHFFFHFAFVPSLSQCFKCNTVIPLYIQLFLSHLSFRLIPYASSSRKYFPIFFSKSDRTMHIKSKIKLLYSIYATYSFTFKIIVCDCLFFLDSCGKEECKQPYLYAFWLSSFICIVDKHFMHR